MNAERPAEGSCPSAEILQQLAQGTLPPDAEIHVTAHLDECAKCQALIDQLVPADLAMSAKKVLSGATEIPAALSALLQSAEADIAESTNAVSQTLANAQGSTGGNPAGNSIADLQPWLTATDDDSLGQIGDYRLTSVLGRGGMGVVFRSEDVRLERSVAVKILAPALLSDPNSTQRFLREAKAVAAISHPGIVGIYEVAQDAKLPYFVMEYVDGRSLEDHLKTGRSFRVNEVLKIGYNVAKALHAAHEAGLIHRDIKPANILVESKTGRVRLMDFGLVRSTKDDGLTGSGTLLGSPSYMAPETIAEQPQDKRTDLFSLGAVLYRLLSGRLPFEAETVVGTIHAISQGKFEPLRQVQAGVPQELANIVDGLLSLNPEDRPQSAAQVAQALREAKRGVTTVTGRANSSKAAWYAANSAKMLLSAAAALIVVLGSTIFYRAFLVDPAQGTTSPEDSPVTMETDVEQSPLVEQAPDPSSADSSTTEKPPAAPDVPGSSGRFTCLNQDGDVDSRFDSLNDAASRVEDGGTILIAQGDALTITRTIDFADRKVTIAGAGDGGVRITADLLGDRPVFASSAQMTLNAINFHAALDKENEDLRLLSCSNAALTCNGCRFELEDGCAIELDNPTSAVFEDCQFFSSGGAAVSWAGEQDRGTLKLRNCLFCCDIAITTFSALPKQIDILHCRAITSHFLAVEPDAEQPFPQIYVTESTILSEDSAISVLMQKDSDPQQLPDHFVWAGKANRYTDPILMVFQETGEEEPEVEESLDLAEWQTLSQVQESETTVISFDWLEEVSDYELHELIEEGSEVEEEIRELMLALEEQ